jgi:hypothetical protein
MSDKVRDLIIQAAITANCKKVIDDADNKSEALSKASAVLSTKTNYNDDDDSTKSYEKDRE